MFGLAIGALCGICWLQVQRSLPPIDIFYWPLALVSGAGLVLQRLPDGWLKRPAILVLTTAIAAVLAGMLATVIAQGELDRRLPEALDRQSFWLDVVVKDLPTRQDHGWRFEVEVEHAAPLGGDSDETDDAEADDRKTGGTSNNVMTDDRFPSRGVLYWNVPHTDQMPLDLRPGQRWRVQAKVRQATGTLNPGGFDLEAWMLEKHLYFNATVQQGKRFSAPVLLGHEDGFQTRVDQARDAIRRLVDQTLLESSVRDVIVALLVGDQRAISAADWTVFQKTGVSHLMSISGLHVTMLAALAGWIGGGLWRLLCRWPLSAGLWIPVQSVAAVFSILGAVGYAMLAGFAVPAQRTAWMVVVVSISKILGVRANPWAVLAIALLVVILPDPMAVLAPGFWLSFLAVAFLFTLPDAEDDRHRWTRIQKLLHGLRQAGHAQIAMTFGLLPLTVLLFQQVVLVGPLANAVAIPVVSYLVTPLSMLGVLELWSVGSGLGLKAAALTQETLEIFLQWCAGLSFASIDWPSPGVVRAAIASAGMVVALGDVLHGPLRKFRHFGWCGLWVLVGAAPPGPAFGDIEAIFMDVGQGSSVLVRTQGHVLLYDTGPQTGTSDAGARVVMPELRRNGVSLVDRLMVSHLDQDHSGGLRSLLSLVPVGKLITSHPEDLAPDLTTTGLSKGLQATPCRAGDAWQWDGVHFQVLHPSDHVPTEEPSKRARRRPRKAKPEPPIESASSNSLPDSQPVPLSAAKLRSQRNADSCVIRIEDRHGGSLLLTGDIPLKAERALVGRFNSLFDPEDESALELAGVKIRSQVLMAPHHGSRTSSSEELLRAVDPSLVVVQAGYKNRYGHPHAEVLNRIGDLNRPGTMPIRIARTDLQGALHLRWVQGGLQLRDFWADNQRYWHIPRQAN